MMKYSKRVHAMFAAAAVAMGMMIVPSPVAASVSTLGNTTGKFYPHNSGFISEICDRTDNDTRDRHLILVKGIGGFLVVGDTHPDPDGFGGKCGYRFYERDKAGHKVASNRGGTTERH